MYVAPSNSSPFLILDVLHKVIPDTGESTADLEDALSEVWRRVVRAVGGSEAQPVRFVAKWKKFRKDIERSFKNTALARYNTWIRPSKRQRHEESESPAPRKGKRLKTQYVSSS